MRICFNQRNLRVIHLDLNEERIRKYLKGFDENDLMQFSTNTFFKKDIAEVRKLTEAIA